MGDKRPILVLDDDAEVVRLVHRVLEHDGYAVVGATDARSALSLAEEARPCLVLADLMMPHMDGEIFIAALKARLGASTPPIVLVTASMARRDVARRCGAAATLEKPFDIQDVRDLVARFCSR